MKNIAIVTIFAILAVIGMPLETQAGESATNAALTLNNRNSRGYVKQKRIKRKPKRRCRSNRANSRRYYRSAPRYRVAGNSYRRQSRRSFYRRHRNASNVAIGTGAGAIIGGILGGKKGALIGAGVGAGAGAAYTYGIRPKKKRNRSYRNYR